MPILNDYFKYGLGLGDKTLGITSTTSNQPTAGNESFSLKNYYSNPQPTQSQFMQDIYGGATQTQTQTLPNGGGTYNPTGGAAISPTKPVVPSIPGNDLYAKYRDPKTGDIMTPEEYAIYLGNKVPKGNGQIPNYAGDAVTNPNQSSEELIGRATDLNNARNDIAVGASDPYKVGNKSGIAYSPAELKAIENAYAGVYDPALKDVFSRLRDKQAADKEIADREESDRARRFSTDESIRLYNNTTGLNKGGGSGSGESVSDVFTPTQLHNAARNAAVDIRLLETGEGPWSSIDLVNYFVNPPKAMDWEGKNVSQPKAIESYFEEVERDNMSKSEMIDKINSSDMTQSVKDYYILKLSNLVVNYKKWGSKNK